MNESPPQAEETLLMGEEEYPDSDGRPMADNTLQYQWIVTIQGNLDRLLPDHFVAGDLLWYPVEGSPKIRMAPDVMVVLGRAKGYRGSYQQWKEDGIAPQVVFEVLSPGNRAAEMENKLVFYQQYGVSEYYLLDPEKGSLQIALRRGGLLASRSLNRAFTSPLLGIRFVRAQGQLAVLDPQGRPFESFLDLSKRAEAERRQKEEALALAGDERRQKEEALALAGDERRQKEEALSRMAQMEAELKALRDRLR